MPAPMLQMYICPWCEWVCDLVKTQLGMFYVCRNGNCSFSCRADHRLNKYVPSDQAVINVTEKQRPEYFGRKVA